jgi:hypothetical protein
VRVFRAKAFVASTTFTADFKAWKLAADPCSFMRFGKDVKTSVPFGHDFDALWHVHLTPEDDVDLERWERHFRSVAHNLRCKRTSDTLLYYAEYNSDFLLLTVDNHGIMSPPLDELHALCDSADAWVKHMKTNP